MMAMISERSCEASEWTRGDKSGRMETVMIRAESRYMGSGCVEASPRPRAWNLGSQGDDATRPQTITGV